MTAKWIATILRDEGHSVEVADTVAEARRLSSTRAYDLLVVDVELPDGSGVDFIQAVRGEGQKMPIVILTGGGADETVVAGLDAGADDFLVKPIANAVLAARVRAALRRGGPLQVDELVFGTLSIHRSTRSARAAGFELDLTSQEFNLIEYLMQRSDGVVSRSELLEHVWGVGFDPGTNRVEVAVSRLRQKLAAAPGAPDIVSIRGAGYRLVIP